MPQTPADTLLAVSISVPSVYANNVIFSTVLGGTKLTFIEVAENGAIVPRCSVVLPPMTMDKMLETLQEHLAKASSPAMTPNTLQ